MLLEQVQIGSPLLWVKTEDSSRLKEYLVASSSKRFYTIDIVNGFCEYDKQENKWRPFLVEILDPTLNEVTQKVTYEFVVAYEHMEKNNLLTNSCFLHNVYGEPEMFIMRHMMNFMLSYNEFRTSFYQDDASSMPLQHIVFSMVDCPQQYAAYFSNVEGSVMSLQEIKDFVHHISLCSDLEINENESNEIARAALGLSEFSLINLSMLSLFNKKKLDPKYIYDNKMQKLKQNGILEIVKPRVSFDDIGGLESMKDLMKRNVWLWNNPEEARRFGIEPLRRILMVGVPGTGKSAICEATASEMQLDLARTGVSQIMNSFVGQSEANMRAVFAQIKAMAPLCVWIDEFGRDLSGGASSSSVDAGTTDRVHGEFLTGLQELPSNVFLLCAANQIENLRPEMLRADRFDKIMFVGLPSFTERKSIFEIYLSVIKDVDFNYDTLSEATVGFTGAEIKSLIKETKFYVASTFLRPVNTDDIINYAPKMRNIIWNKNRPLIQDLYRTALEQWDFASIEQFEDAQKIVSGNYTARSQVIANKGYNW